jgi:hypothetical protein
MIYKLIEFIKEIDQLIKIAGISSNMIILVISINFNRDRYFYLGFGASINISDISEIWQSL